MEKTEKTFDVSAGFKALSRNAVLGLGEGLRSTASNVLKGTPGQLGIDVAMELLKLVEGMGEEFEQALEMLKQEQILENQKAQKEAQSSLLLPGQLPRIS